MWLPLACTPLRHRFGHSCALENCLRALHFGISQMKQLLPIDKGWSHGERAFFLPNMKGVGKRLESQVVTKCLLE